LDYRFLIAKRYLKSRKRVSLISIITGISVSGVAIGVALLVIVLSVLNGFYDVVRDLLLSVDPHVRIVAAESRGFQPSDTLKQQVRELPHVREITPYVEGKALLTYSGQANVNKVVIVRGIDPAALQADSDDTERIIYGSADLSMRDGTPGILIGRRLGTRLGIVPGQNNSESSTVGLLSATGIDELLNQSSRGSPLLLFNARGFYQLASVYDENHVFVRIDQAQRLFQMGTDISGVDLRLSDPDYAGDVKQHLETRLDPAHYTVQTWYDLQESLYQVMRLEKWGASLILTLIVVVAAFNIVGSLTMVVIEKRRDLGVLQAMGVSRKNIRRIFMLEGALIGAVGTGIGLLLGLALTYVQKYTGLVPLAGAESFIIDAYPVLVQWTDLLVVGGVALGLCVLAALYPAARAAAVPPAQVVQTDR
jgi:lipoprotein-releasing system permease protein